MNIKKDLDFPSYGPDSEDGTVHVTKMVESVEGVEEYLKELNEQTLKKYDVFTVGEVFNMKKEQLGTFIGEEGVFSNILENHDESRAISRFLPPYAQNR